VKGRHVATCSAAVLLVTKGTVHLRTATDCVAVAYGAGQAVFIPADVPHVVVNDGPADAEALVTYTLPADHALRDDAPAVCP
jgi:quercetin dioxygenase-like cupin family protein